MKWEYRTMGVFEGVDILTLLNQCSEEGWEFVWCDIDRNVFIFKRPCENVIIEKEAVEGYFGGKVG
jgi:hypothetical protein